MYSLYKKDLKRRKAFKKEEINFLKHKILFKDTRFEESLRIVGYVRLLKLPRISYRVRIRNRCFVTYRGRGVFRFFHLSRLQLRAYAGQGILSGFKKSSW